MNKLFMPISLTIHAKFVHVPISNDVIIFKEVVSKTLNKEKVLVTSNAHIQHML
jgi:hypothetical protein